MFINSGTSGDALNEATRKWQDAGLDVALDDLGFPGDRNDAATYLADRGWQPSGMIVASDTKGDYGFLDLAKTAFDLTDRGVKGRAAPKALDAFLFTERGVYRSGETVYATALLRERNSGLM